MMTSNSSCSHSPLPPSAHPSTSTLSASPTIETLIPHLLASKRSLSSIAQVQRANDLCMYTHIALEKAAITTASTSFLRSGIESQLRVLEQVQAKTEHTVQWGKKEFQDVMRGVNEADGRLKYTLERLKTTIVEARLRPEGEERRCLLDFVDERGVEGLVGVVRGVVDEAGQELKRFDEQSKRFEKEVVGIWRMLNPSEDESVNGRKGFGRLGSGSSLADVLQELEDHAQEMAENLESLVKHFDLCVTAIRHTEGGGDAASKIAGDLPEGLGISHTPPETISQEEFADMARILEADAAQVDEVVMEIGSHLADMETLYEGVEAQIEELTTRYANMSKAFVMLEDIGRKLPSYITRNQVFLLRWENDKVKIEEHLSELENGREVYAGFLRSYDKLLIEVGRRRAAEQEMDKVVQSARVRLEKLYEDEFEDRATFKEEHGYFLPSDLWAGFESRPLQHEIKQVSDQDARIPHVSASVIRRAIQRVHEEG